MYQVRVCAFGLRSRVVVVDGADARQVLVLEPVAPVVLVAEPAEQLGERELDALGLALVPRRGAEDSRRRSAGDTVFICSTPTTSAQS